MDILNTDEGFSVIGAICCLDSLSDEQSYFMCVCVCVRIRHIPNSVCVHIIKVLKAIKPTLRTESEQIAHLAPGL